MTPAETLDRHAREADRLAHDWPAWRDRPIPDGSPGAARTDGMPRSGDVPNPVLDTVIARDGMLVKDGVNLEAQVNLLSGHLLELTLAMACNAIGHMPANRPDLTAGLRMAMSALALTTTSQNARAWTGCEYDDTTWTQGEAMELVGVYLTRLRVIIPATPATIDDAKIKPAKCEGWGPHAGQCTHLGNHGTKRLPDGSEEIDETRRRLCARCHELATFRCSACGEGLDPTTLAKRPIASGMHFACYQRARRAEDAA